MSIKVLDVLILTEHQFNGDYTTSAVEDHLVTSYQSLNILITNFLAKFIVLDEQILEEISLEALQIKLKLLKMHQKRNQAYLDESFDTNEAPKDYFPIFEKAWECQNKFKRISIRVKERFLDQHWYIE